MSLKPEHLARLAALNLSGEAMSAVLAIIADTHAPSAAAQRQARYRERKNADPSATRDVTSDAHVTQQKHNEVTEQTGNPSRIRAFRIGEEVSILPPEKPTVSTPKGASKRSDRGVRLAQDWRPGDEGRKLAVELLGSNAAAHAELANFRDHWLAKAGPDARKVDWNATWRKWVRKAAEMRATARAGPNIHPWNRNGKISIHDALKDLQDELQSPADRDVFADEGNQIRGSPTRLLSAGGG